MIDSQNNNEKLRVARIKESDSLTLLLSTLVDVVESRFESILCSSEFHLIWTQVREDRIH